MKIKLSEVKVNHMKLIALSQKKLPHKIAYAVAKNLLKLETETELIEDRRMEMIDTYAKKDEEDRPVVIEGKFDLGDNAEIFDKEYAEFLETETEVDIHTVSNAELDMLENPRYDVLTAAEMIALDFMLEENDTGAATE